MRRTRSRPGTAPARLAVRADGELTCPRDGPVRLDRCHGCEYLQGTLEGPTLRVLCGFGHGAPLKRARTADATASAEA